MDEMLTVAEFLTRYKCSRSHFYREVQSARIPLVKLGRASRVTRKDADAWVDSLPVRIGAVT